MVDWEDGNDDNDNGNKNDNSNEKDEDSIFLSIMRDYSLAF